MIYKNVLNLILSLYNNETGQTRFCADIRVDYHTDNGHYYHTDFTELLNKINDIYFEDYDFDLMQVFHKYDQHCPIHEGFIYYNTEVKDYLKVLLDEVLEYLDETYGEDSYA